MTFPYDGLPEAWAVEWGEDRYGVFAGFAVGNVVQRLRWIPPGRFVMGSTATEPGRFDNEMQHEVTVSNGFWFADTQVTQALWEAVMGNNPSCFASPDRPVESIDWDDCQTFLARINEMIPDLNARLPTEEEWEYACRAGTSTSTWAGNIEAIESNFVLPLATIAWYAGNSFFDETEAQTGLSKRFREGTHPVKRKAPNPWGLYDILGNVYEYCSDAHVDYSEKLSGQRTSNSLYRNIRGGSWRSLPKYVRSANRGEQLVTRPDNDLGLRLACNASTG